MFSSTITSETSILPINSTDEKIRGISLHYSREINSFLITEKNLKYKVRSRNFPKGLFNCRIFQKSKQCNYLLLLGISSGNVHNLGLKIRDKGTVNTMYFKAKEQKLHWSICNFYTNVIPLVCNCRVS